MHHDSAGLLTFVRVLDGVKLWAWLDWTKDPTASDLKKAAEALDKGDYVNVQYSAPTPWFTWPPESEDPKFDWGCYQRTQGEHEKYRVARWVMRVVERGTTL